MAVPFLENGEFVFYRQFEECHKTRCVTSGPVVPEAADGYSRSSWEEKAEESFFRSSLGRRAMRKPIRNASI